MINSKYVAACCLSLTFVAGCSGQPVSTTIQESQNRPRPTEKFSVNSIKTPLEEPVLYPRDKNKFSVVAERANSIAKSDVRDKIKRIETNPRFDINQSTSEIEAILADGEPHTITVLFEDSLKIRLKKNLGRAVGRSGHGLSSINGHEERADAIHSVLAKHKLRHVSPIFRADEFTEDELVSQEQDLEHKAKGEDIPNDGSWASIALETYSPAEAKQLVLSLQGTPGVRSAVIANNPKLGAIYYTQTPSDPKFPTQAYWDLGDMASDKYTNDSPAQQCQTWWFNRHSIGAAWYSGTGTATRVAVIDSCFQINDHDGVNYNHGLKKSFWTPWYGGMSSDTNVLPNSNFSVAEKRHGSESAQLIGAEADNNLGVSGAAPGVDLVPIKVPQNDSKAVAEAVKYAYQTGAKVINVSFWFPTGNPNLEADPLIRTAFNNARLNGVTVVYCAGNNGTYIPWDSNMFTYAICVGGIKADQYYDPSSCHGTRVDMAAASDNITIGSVDDSGQYFRTRNASGTSLAAPLVASAAALVYEHTSDFLSVRDILMFTSDIASGRNGATLRQMSGGYNGLEGWEKIRVLNAASAVRVAYLYNPSYPVQVYRPASDDVTYIGTTLSGGSGTTTNWPTNPIRAFTYPITIECDTQNTGGVGWADSSNIFKEGRIFSNHIDGAPYVRSATGSLIRQTDSERPNTSGWANPRYYSVN